MAERPLKIDDTAIAFRAKTTPELWKAYWLFRILQWPWLVRLGTFVVTGALKLHLPVEFLIKKTIFQQFCGGETIEECDRTIEKLAEFGVGTILDYSVEGSQSSASFDRTTREILQTVAKAANHPYIPFTVFKITGLARFALLEKLDAGQPLADAEKAEFAEVHRRVEAICAAAAQARVRVLIDAEESWIQKTIDDLAYRMMVKFNGSAAIVHNTFQMYRRDKLAQLSAEIERAGREGYYLGVKLVRGAYMEKERSRAQARGEESPIFPTKELCDAAYDEALDRCIKHLAKIGLCAGTHNEKSTLHLASLMAAHAIPRDDHRVVFSQLYGMSDHLSFNLADAGFRVAKYVPYGPVHAVIPYLTRRAEENTSIGGQTGRELQMIDRELKRRRGAGSTAAVPTR